MDLHRSQSNNPLGMTDREFGIFCSVLQLDTAEKMRAVEVAASAARQYTAPFAAKARVDVLDNPGPRYLPGRRRLQLRRRHRAAGPAVP